MAIDTDSIKRSLSQITKGHDLLDMLMEVERTIDSLEIYAYKNWDLGEFVSGPEISRYWIKTSWMYPLAKMPDPRAALRLEKIGCKVSFRKDVFKKPVKVFEPTGTEVNQSRKTELEDHPVWIVEINMPMKYISNNSEIIDQYINDELSKEVDTLPNNFESGKGASDSGEF